MASKQVAHCNDNMTSFREANECDIHKYTCPHETWGGISKFFFEIFNIRINGLVIVKDEKEIVCDDETQLPKGVMYGKYAMGVISSVGVFDIDSHFTVTVSRKPISYSLWGPYQRTDWTAGEIEQNFIWRGRLIEKPHRIDRSLVELFEKSRWMVFCFWKEDIEKLIDIELKLFDNILDLDLLSGGLLRYKLPEFYGLKDIAELKEYLKKQYRTTKFHLNDEEIAFDKEQAWFWSKLKLSVKA